MRYAHNIKVGPVSFRIGSDWRAPVDSLAHLYSGYPEVQGACDYSIRLEAMRLWRRYLRPSIAISGDYMLQGAAPMALAHGLLAAEMGMNLQMALGHHNHLLIHAATVEKEGKALILTGHSGSGKSTLAALLAEQGWRLLGDEFALIGFDDSRVHPFPRAISLKNGAIDVLRARVAADRFGPPFTGTPKGLVQHLRPGGDAIARMGEAAMPALLLFPRFDAELPVAIRRVGQAEVFVRLTQASTNYVHSGEKGFAALTQLVRDLPAFALDYSSSDTALNAVSALWEEAV